MVITHWIWKLGTWVWDDHKRKFVGRWTLDEQYSENTTVLFSYPLCTWFCLKCQRKGPGLFLMSTMVVLTGVKGWTQPWNKESGQRLSIWGFSKSWGTGRLWASDYRVLDQNSLTSYAHPQWAVPEGGTTLQSLGLPTLKSLRGKKALKKNNSLLLMQ